MPARRIAVNGKALGRAERDGSIRVACSTIREMARQRPDLDIDVLVPTTAPLSDLAEPWPPGVRIRSVPSRWSHRSVGRSTWEQLRLPGIVKHHGPYDALVNFTNSAPVAVSPGIPQVLVLHDIGFLNTEWFAPQFSWYMRLVVRLAARRAVHVVTVSETSATQIRETLPGLGSVTVIPNDSDDPPGTIEPYGAMHPYVLFLGSMNPRKNLAGCVRGFSRFRGTVDEPAQLLVAGAHQRIFAGRVLADADQESVSILGYVDDATRWSLLAGARLLLLPSFLEGFGLQILEALKVGTPVVASDIPVFRELFRDAVEYVDPRSEEDIAAGIRRVWCDAALREDLAQRGREVAERYSWPSSARKYLELLDNIAEGRT